MAQKTRPRILNLPLQYTRSVVVWLSDIYKYGLNMMLIDFLEGSKKNQRLLYKLLTALYVVQIPIVIYLAAFITPGEYPAWWQVIVDWGQHNILSAQGWSGRTITHREEMPAIYMVWFIFSMLTLIFAILLIDEDVWPSASFVEKGMARGMYDNFIYMCAVGGMFWWCYLRGQAVPITEPLSFGLGTLVEHIPGLLFWTGFYMVCNTVLIPSPVVLLRKQLAKALKYYRDNKE